jgi:hypothetical protein
MPLLCAEKWSPGETNWIREWRTQLPIHDARRIRVAGTLTPVTGAIVTRHPYFLTDGDILAALFVQHIYTRPRSTCVSYMHLARG